LGVLNYNFSDNYRGGGGEEKGRKRGIKKKNKSGFNAMEGG